jgi:hypothetical protein
VSGDPADRRLPETWHLRIVASSFGGIRDDENMMTIKAFHDSFAVLEAIAYR